MLTRTISRSASRVAAARTVSRGTSPLAQCFLPSRSFSSHPKKEEKKEEKKEDAIKSLSSEDLMKRKALADLPITFSDISRAKVAIRGGVVRTECVKSYFLSELTGANIYIKPEIRQFTGSFKERGARNAIMQVQREKKGALKGVIAASAGNHALALAYHGKELGVPATVVMPVVAPLAKVDKCRVSINHFDFLGICDVLPAKS
jgi:predicted alternative tryptophan synthase beta-subunit